MVSSTALLALALGVPAARPVLAEPASIPPIPVTSTLDVVDDHPGDGVCHTDVNSAAAGKCTLRAAVMTADAATGDGATIIVPPGIYTLIIPPADITDGPSNGDLNLTTPMNGSNPVISIIGAGAGQTIIDGSRQDRVLSVATGRTATISGVTLRNGLRTNGGAGGGLANDGNLTLDSSTVTGNQTSGNFAEGGGIFSSHAMTVTNSTIGPNNLSFNGGGIFIFDGIFTLDRSTVYGNSADSGAGIFNAAASNLYLINSTISQNTADTNGGGLYNVDTANAYNATIVFNGADTDRNSSPAAGGVYSADSSTFNLRNTLLAGNYHSSDRSSEADCTGTIHSYGVNLIGEASESACNVEVDDGGFDYVNSLFLIGPLQNNGGPTLTHALLAGSNAIDKGDLANGCIGPSAPLATDQRGFPRVVGLRCDIGAFEYMPPVAFLPTVSR